MPAADEQLRYPVGRFAPPATFTPETRRASIATLAALPGELRAVVAPLSASDIARPYRPGGWTVTQVVHHLADSHLNAYIRVKFALTEDEPTVKPYDEAIWAQLPDVAAVPATVSLDLIEALHRRWTPLLDAMSDAQWARAYRHPEQGLVPLDRAVAMYAWHSRHHLAHIHQALHP